VLSTNWAQPAAASNKRSLPVSLGPCWRMLCRLFVRAQGSSLGRYWSAAAGVHQQQPQ
jgi:hypothetical protein